jgi:1,4-alpha-glucan branching enzyme
MPVAREHIDCLIANQERDPYSILGPHLQTIDDRLVWEIRAYLPHATSVSVLLPEEKLEIPMIPDDRHPQFFVGTIDQADLHNYQFRVVEGDRTRVIYDPYAFRSGGITEFDVHLFVEGNHHHIYEKLGAHPMVQGGVGGVYFAVWAPNARNVSILGDFNAWDGRQHQMAIKGGGIWELFVPELTIGTSYKYEIKNYDGHIYEKTDPYGFQQEVRPKTASIVADLDKYQWQDEEWLAKRRERSTLEEPIAIYECHLGSWLHADINSPSVSEIGEPLPIVQVSDNKPGARFLNYRELADRLIPYVQKLGFNYIELLPISEHPFDGSWGYQVTGYYAPTSRFGSPEDFMYFVDRCHAADIGVILDWVPGHFPKDGHGLAFFDGTHLYEHADPRQGEHKEWGTLIFNYGRNEVRNFLVANALFWFDKYHLDGIRVDAVASMLYLDYARKDGEWVANQYGGRENIEAADFLRQVNHLLFTYFPGILSIAEESTAWPMVSWPTYMGGLGFNLKWNMGWMHDMLDYFKLDPWFRQYHQNNVTFSMWYHHSENYMLALSHDEVVHGKSSIIGKMPGDEWQKLANVRALFGYMFTHPGKKTLFMGMEFGQWSEWNVWGDLEWQLLQYEPHQQLSTYFQDLTALYRREPALYSADFQESGFAWIDCNDRSHSIVSFIRRAKDDNNFVIVVCNFTPQPHSHYRIGVPEHGFYAEIFNSDSRTYGGSNMGNLGGKWADEWSIHNYRYSLDLCLPPLSVSVFKIQENSPTNLLEGSTPPE